MKIVLTGASGFVGAHVACALIDAGDEVYAVSRSSDPARLKGAPALHLLEADLHSPAGRERIADVRPDACVHAAWCTEPGSYLSSLDNLDLQCASLLLAKTLAARGCRRLVALGTCFEYDTAFGLLSEQTPLAPRHLYAAAKAGTFFSLQQLGALTGMEIAWARLFYLYGPGEHTQRLVPSVIRRLLRGEEARTTPGQQVRDFLYVEDVASAIAALARSNVVGPVNVASGQPVTVEAIVRQLGELTGRPDLVRLGAVPYGASDPMFICADNRKLLGATGWRPRWSLSTGLAKTVAWWRSHEQRDEPRLRP